MEEPLCYGSFSFLCLLGAGTKGVHHTTLVIINIWLFLHLLWLSGIPTNVSTVQRVEIGMISGSSAILVC